VGYHIYLQHGTPVCWHFKIGLQSGPVTAYLTTTVVHGYKLLINDGQSLIRFYRSRLCDFIRADTFCRNHYSEWRYYLNWFRNKQFWIWRSRNITCSQPL